MTEKRILLVTGASSDVGIGLIKNITPNYEKIWVHYRSSDSVIECLREEFGDSIIPVQADFSDMESTERMINLIRDSGNFPDHIIHLSAPRVHNLQFHKLNWETYQKEIDISLRSIIMILQQFIPYMSKKKYGKIIFMLSAYLVGMPPSFLSSYITVKYALLGLMRNLAVEYASKRISVNAVSPDMMETKFLVDIPELVKEQSASNSPLGRNLFVEEVIPTLLYLLSDACDVVTGQNIHIGMSFKK